MMKTTVTLLFVGLVSMTRVAAAPAPATNTYKTLKNLLRVVEGRDVSSGRAKLSYAGQKRGESPVYYIQMPPTPYYFSHNLPLSNKNQFDNVPVAFKTNGKPSKIYHWKNKVDNRKKKLTPKYTSSVKPQLNTPPKHTSILKHKSSITKVKPMASPTKGDLMPAKSSPINYNLYSTKSTPRNDHLVQSRTSPSNLYLTTKKSSTRNHYLMSTKSPSKTSPIKSTINNKINIQKNTKIPPISSSYKGIKAMPFKQSPIFRIRPASNSRQPSARQWSGQKKYYNGKPSGLYLWESKSWNTYKDPVYMKLKT